MDLEWIWTYDQGQAFAIRILKQAFETLKADPGFAFTQDQMEALKPFWDSLSDPDRQVLRRLVAERRFEVATGMFDQPDVNEPDFESLTRQFLMAKPWMEQTFGAQILTAWNIDTFGQTLQMPQLFRKAGLRYFFFERDYPTPVKDTAKNLFYWQSPDGSTVLAHLNNYSLGTWLRPEPVLGLVMRPMGLNYLKDLIRRNPAGNDKIMIPWGADEYLPKEDSREIESIVRQAAAAINVPVKAVLISTASKYFEMVEHSGTPLPTYTYDFNPPLAYFGDLRGIWGERPAQKLAERSVEDLLEGSEKLCSIMSVYGQPYPTHALQWGWERVLANQVHDTMAGSAADPTIDVARSRYIGAAEAARDAQANALFQLSRAIDTAPNPGYPLVVFNTLSYPRTELVRYTQTFQQEANISNRQLSNFRLLDVQGRSIPFRVMSASRFGGFADEIEDATAAKSMRESNALTMAEIEFVAADVPPMGYRIFTLEPVRGELAEPSPQPLEGEVSNPYFRLRVDASTGLVSELVDLRSGKNLLHTARYGGNELVLEEEKNPDMEGPLHFTGTEIRGRDWPAQSVSKLADPLGTTIRIQGFFLGGERVQEIRLYDSLPRIDFKTELKGFPGHDGMLTVVFPLAQREGAKNLYETHNAVVERPDGIYWAHTWMDMASSRGGLAIINRGAGGYQVSGDLARLILLRSVTHYRAYQAAAAAERGNHLFEYSLYVRDGDWSESGLLEQAHSVNSPLRIISTDAHSGTLPKEHAFLSVPSGNFEVTALKKAEHGDELILRGHETRGRSGHVQLELAIPVQQARMADLLEKPGIEIPLHDGTLEFDAQPFEFVTVRLGVKH
jgi:alpha-mannosidase